ncbi:nucleoside recognition domain-containing protein [Salibacter halophilus]|uniref:Nucleoside transporter/FeoB GTPase Gate domain-containing protein n=1 Tax=Salibacter halophilus TaxID=1803916 RepID=A0A6N6M9Y3_9FLAO|nr:nucleoside recognition domain-containing protein [Salibacter halophilus]KAB1065060.1 hypothetical protein F3059_03670 [Salibacter halophilus]
MVLNYIFIGFFVIAFVVALVRTIGYFFRDQLEAIGLVFDESDLYVFRDMVQSTFDMADTSIAIVLTLIGVMTFWLGILRVGEKAGVIAWLSKKIEPFFIRLFPEIPRNHNAHGAIMMNFAANMLGLDNAATPFGIKAMEQLQDANTNKKTASNAQIMFLVLNTSGLTLIPVSVMALRAAEGASTPTDVFLPILLATYFATITGLIFVSIRQRINLFNKTMLLVLGGLTIFVLALVTWLTQMPDNFAEKFSVVSGNLILFCVIVGFILLALKRKVDVYQTFIDGAKEGFNVGVKIIPYLVGMLISIAVFRASGTLDWIIGGIEFLVSWFGFNTDFVGALPTAVMKPLSGSGARAMMVETMSNYGSDSFQGFLAGVFQGSTETTFYTIAVYYGAINVTRTRYTATAGLFADFMGIVAAIIIAYIFW